jgi:small subunit ribosomal protein S10
MKLRIFIKSFDKQLIEKISKDLVEFSKNVECTLSGVVALPTRIKKYCVLRSPHIDKDSREHFEVRSYKRFFDFTTNSPAVLNALLKLQVPLGVYSSLEILEKN